MGVAGSKASEADAVEEQSTGRPRISQGTKRRQPDEAASRSPKKHKAAKESESHLHVDLAFRSPRPRPNSNSTVYRDGHVEPSRTIVQPDAATTTDMPIAKSLGFPAEQSQPDIEAPRNITPDPVAEISHAIVASPQFQHTLHYLRQESEEVPSGWAVAAAAPISQSQLQQNLAMIRKASADLKDVHLTAIYRKDNLQLSITTIPTKDTDIRSRASRRASVQPPGLPAIQRGNSTRQGPDPAPLGPVATKRPHAVGNIDANRGRKRRRRASGEDGQSYLLKRPVCKLRGLWRKDDWSGWSGLLKREF
jgi:hypothetical protein